MSAQTTSPTTTATVTNRIVTTAELEANERDQLDLLWGAYGHLYPSKSAFLAKFHSRKSRARIEALTEAEIERARQEAG